MTTFYTYPELTPTRAIMFRMILRVSALLVVGARLCAGCNCSEPKVEFKRDHAEVIFRGTIIELRSSSKKFAITAGWGEDLGKTVVFRVSRVWKGRVGQTFEMPAIEETSMCVGFWPNYLKVGEELLVYASHYEGSEYITGICGGHKQAKDAQKDFRILGRGGGPEQSIQIPK